MRKVLVACIGNPDRGDDGIGSVVAASLAGRLPPGVSLIHRSSDMLALVEELSGFDALICADAAAPAGRPGRIHRLELSKDELPRNLFPSSTHGFGLPDAIELAHALGTAPRRIIVYAIEGVCFEAGAPLTSAASAAATEVAERIIAEAKGLLTA
jgi:hydrogenase maturation protease